MQSRTSQNLNMRAIMEDTISQLIDKNDTNFTHCFREANKVANYVTKWERLKDRQSTTILMKCQIVLRAHSSKTKRICLILGSNMTRPIFL